MLFSSANFLLVLPLFLATCCPALDVLPLVLRRAALHSARGSGLLSEMRHGTCWRPNLSWNRYEKRRYFRCRASGTLAATVCSLVVLPALVRIWLCAQPLDSVGGDADGINVTADLSRSLELSDEFGKSNNLFVRLSAATMASSGVTLKNHDDSGLLLADATFGKERSSSTTRYR